MHSKMEEQKKVDMEETEEEEMGNDFINNMDGRALTENDENVVFIGSKPLVNYVRSVMMQFNKRNASEVIIKSRGKFISKAVDVAEVAKRSLERNGVKTKDIKISSETFEKDGKTINISAMDIVLGV